MNKDPSSLSNLHDIVMPEPVPIWPPGPGGFLLLCLLLLIMLFAAYYVYTRWQKNGYRRAGLALLKDAVTVHDVSVLLKRVALATFPWENVASLYGREWILFLNKTCSKTDFQEENLLEAIDKPVRPEVIDSARKWIKHHSVIKNHTHER